MRAYSAFLSPGGASESTVPPCLILERLVVLMSVAPIVIAADSDNIKEPSRPTRF
jgi:hypothetical protein